jgi:hypothetical protein
MRKVRLRPLNELRNVFRSDETKFIMATGLKVAGVSLIISLIVYFYILQVTRINYVFFKSHGFPDFFEESTFRAFVAQEAVANLPFLFAFHIFLFFIGTYVGWLILRPFRTLGLYCEEALQSPNVIYRVDEFSAYKLLTRFSEFFFEYIRESRKRGELVIQSIPPQYSKIHRPVPDRIFMLHFGILLLIMAISSSVFIIQNASAIFNGIIELANKTLPTELSANQFLLKQKFLLDDLIVLTIVLITVLYTLLGIHLYAQVSGAAFGIFSTMRSFMKGNCFSRVHLLGFAHVRDSTRKLNKYLDYIQNNFDKGKGKG